MVLSDVLTVIEDKKVTLLAILELSVAFNCVDYILLSRLQSRFGLDGVVLAWIRSFLSDRTQRVCFRGCLSAEMALRRSAGIRSWSLLFLFYKAELFDIIASLGRTGHSYADDTQAYTSAPVVESQEAPTRLTECIERLDRWMGQNGLKVNAEKTRCCGLDRGINQPCRTSLSSPW